jgi:hypothetical protein
VGNDEILSYNDKYVSNSKGSSKGMSSTKRKLPADLSFRTVRTNTPNGNRYVQSARLLRCLKN